MLTSKPPSCAICQYFRESAWCSNSKSPHFRQPVKETATCKAFYERGKPAPGWLLALTGTLKQGKKE